MNLHISKPKDYDEGAYHASAYLDQNERACYEQYPIAFEIPNLKNRFFRQQAGYRMAVPLGDDKVELRGIFKDGIWHSDFYTNGISEQENKTSVSMVKSALEVNILKAIETAISWCGLQ